jgi:hypothetical protein
VPRWIVLAVLLVLYVAPGAASQMGPGQMSGTYPSASLGRETARPALHRIGAVVDGDTVDLTDGAPVRLVQIDTPEIYFGTECYGRHASAITKRILPPGTEIRLAPELATDRVVGYGRLLRYVVRAHDGLNVNVYFGADRCGSALLLQRPARPIRDVARQAGSASSSSTSRAVGCVPADALRPVSGCGNPSVKLPTR